MTQPSVSIIAPCYNGEKYLERFLRSVLSQTYSNLEVILINDGSTDRTEDIVDSFSNQFRTKGIRFIYQKQENTGQAAALNRGLKLFNGEYMNWMDSDDEISPEFIEKRTAFLASHQEYAFCHGKCVFVNENAPDTVVKTVGKRPEMGGHAFFEDILYVRNVFFPGYMVRTTDLDRAVQNREIYSGPGGQNAQLLLPLAWYYGDPGYAEDSIYKYYVRENSHSHSIDSSEKVIQQLEKYESILINTLDRIQDPEAHKYISDVRRYYTRQCFGNAVDTMRPRLIRKYYKQLCAVDAASFHDTALYLKYSLMARLKGRNN